MKKVFDVLNELEKEGIIKRYALGGATALLFYAEPELTYDIDVFVFLPADSSQTNQIIDLSPVYKALQKKGYKAKKEHILIDNIPVQLIPAYNELIEEGVEDAASKNYGGIKTKVIRVEHLVAIMLQTNRPKDRERIGRLLEEGVKMDRDKLFQILSRHNLKERWEKIIEKER